MSGTAYQRLAEPTVVAAGLDAARVLGRRRDAHGHAYIRRRRHLKVRGAHR